MSWFAVGFNPASKFGLWRSNGIRDVGRAVAIQECEAHYPGHFNGNGD